MAVPFNDPEAERLARAVADLTGETPTQAVIVALRERLARVERPDPAAEATVADALAIGRHCAAMPVLDPRPPDAILAYDARGLPG